MFYKETDFHVSPIGKIPREWKAIKLIEAADYINGYAFSPRDWRNEGLPIIRIQNLNNSGASFNYYDEKIDDRYSVKNGDLLFAWSASIGCYIWNKGNALLNQHIFKVLPKKGINKQYLYYTLFLAIEQLKSRVHGSTMKHFTRGELKTAEIPLPLNEKEQQKIAGVLSCVDLAIQKTDEVIAKTERLKKGLMQELLTKGIGHKEFKDTEIGKIPEKWELVRLKNVVEINKESRDPSKDMPEQNFLYVDIDSIERGTGKIGDPKTILGIKAPSRARRVIHENDVIMSTVRPYLKAFAIIPKKYEDQICSTGFAVLSSTKKILPYFLLNILFSDQTMNQCNRMMMGGQYPALNESQVTKIKIPLPPLSEQQRIAEIFLAIDDKLELEKQEKEGLERIKQGSMDLLLTGKVRVRVD